MKLVTFSHENTVRPGVLTADETRVLPLPYPDMQTLIESPADQVRAAVSQASGPAIPLGEVRLLAPIPHPRQDVICLGVNYRDHAEESARVTGTHRAGSIPIYFSKRVAEAVPPGGWIESHADLDLQLDYEAELAVIIGKTARNVPADRAAEYVFGYTVLNDVSARELQHAHVQWYFGKSLDGFTPMGPWIVTADEIPFPPALEIRSSVNGEARQRSNTALFINSIQDVLEELTAGMTLLPGTIIATGTPAGVGMGFDPPKFLQSGDVVECAIEGIGALRSTVV